MLFDFFSKMFQRLEEIAIYWGINASAAGLSNLSVSPWSSVLFTNTVFSMTLLRYKTRGGSGEKQK